MKDPIRLAARAAIHEAVERVLEPRKVALEKLFERCQSPIEVNLLAALLITKGTTLELEEGNTCRHGIGAFVGYGSGVLAVQQEVAGYRVDFAAWPVGREGIVDVRRVVIEADGHDFHERTRDQAARDRRMDRELQARGWTVLRFTGSEIHREPERCAWEAWRAWWEPIEREATG